MLSDVINGGETAEEITRRTTNTDIPCLVIWGRDDKVNIIPLVHLLSLNVLLLLVMGYTISWNIQIKFVKYYILSIIILQICHPSGAKLAKKLKPQTKVILLNECGHCISVDRPGKTARFITRFINKQSCVL